MTYLRPFNFKNCTDENTLLLLVGNKIDLMHKRSVLKENGEALAKVCVLYVVRATQPRSQGFLPFLYRVRAASPLHATLI